MVKHLLLMLVLSGCHHYAVVDLGPDRDHLNRFRCLGFCHEGLHLYDVKISKDHRRCYCGPDKLSD